MKDEDRFITVVFKCKGASELVSSMTEAFKGDGKYGDAVITAISLEDEISRAEKLEAATE